MQLTLYAENVYWLIALPAYWQRGRSKCVEQSAKRLNLWHLTAASRVSTYLFLYFLQLLTDDWLLRLKHWSTCERLCCDCCHITAITK